MKHRLIGASLLALALSAGAAFANAIVDTIVGDLRAQGYVQIDVSRTLLGRTRIEATSTAFHREIILDPRTGEILRDYWEVLLDASGEPVAGSPQSPSLVGSGSSGSGTSGSGSGSDDDDDDDDDDNSGSGSSGSGSGSNSGSGGSSGSGGGSSDDDDD